MPDAPPIRVIRRTIPDARLDTALSRALLIQVGNGALGPSLRLSVPERVVAFGKHDTLHPGYPEAVRAARTAGFDAVVRLAGGRAAVFHEHTLAFSWTVPDPDPAGSIHSRYQTLAETMVRAFARIGVSTEVGEVPGEYCPGAYSVHLPDGPKVMGVGQRLGSGAAHVGGVVVVRDGAIVRDVLTPVYAELGLGWDPTTAGSLADATPDVTVTDAEAAILAEFGALGGLTNGDVDDETLELARRLAPQHEADLHLG